MSNISDLMKQLNLIKQNTALTELSQIQMKYSVPQANELIAIKQSLETYNLLRHAGVTNLLSGTSIQTLNESITLLKSLSPATAHLQSIISEFQALTSKWENVSKRYDTPSPHESSKTVKIDDELYEQMSVTIDAIIPDEDTGKPEILKKVKHQLSFEQLIALIGLLFQLISFVIGVYSSNATSQQDKLAKQEQLISEKSTNELLENIDHKQESLLIVAQSLANSVQRLTEIAEDHGLIPESGEDISSEINERDAQEKHIDNQHKNENSEPKN